MPVAFESGTVAVREAIWGDVHVSHETYKKRFDVSPLLKGLPGGRCPCPHWGIVLKGSMKVNGAGSPEIVRAGEFYYLAPGHAPVMDAGTELVEFSLNDAFQKLMETVGPNFEAMAKAGTI